MPVRGVRDRSLPEPLASKADKAYAQSVEEAERGKPSRARDRTTQQVFTNSPGYEPKQGNSTHDFLIPACFVIWSGHRHDRRSVSRLEMIGLAGHALPGRAERVGRHVGGLLKRPGLPVSHRAIIGPPHRNGRRRPVSPCDSRSRSHEADGSRDLPSAAGKQLQFRAESLRAYKTLYLQRRLTLCSISLVR